MEHSSQDSLQPRNHYYDGLPFRCIDFLMRKRREQVTALIPQGASVLDIGCGSGEQLFAMARKISKGVGVELSQILLLGAHRKLKSKLQNAQETPRPENYDHLSFHFADATDLRQCPERRFPDNDFDIATSTLVLHEVPTLEQRLQILREMARVAARVMVIDWTCPPPSTIAKISTNIVEILGGRDHYRAYRSYLSHGGMEPLLNTASLRCARKYPWDTVTLWDCEREK